MIVSEYAKELGISVEELLKKCKELSIEASNGDSELDDEAIIILDNTLTEVVEKESVELEEAPYNDEDTLDTIVDNIVESSGVKTEGIVTKQKLKKKSSINLHEKDSEFLNKKKQIYKKKEKLQSNKQEVSNNVITYIENMSVNDLAEALEVPATELVKKLIMMGLMISSNEPISFENAEIIVLDYKKELKKEEETDISNFEEYVILDDEESLEPRPAVVTIMGHVDHGKTTLLDYIRNTSVASGEAGGITQAIGAYQTEQKGKKITFIDTPGHAAFTEMRARGASVTDIVIIIVAADDGVMPQTKEAIDHAKAAGVPIIVAINKIDKPGANFDKIMSELSEAGLTPEEWGGDTIFVKISAVTGEGVDLLLDNIIALSEVLDLKANPNRYATGSVLEARLDKNIGSTVTLLVQNGTLRLGDPIVVGSSFGKVRTLVDSNNKNLVEATPSMPVEVTGINEVPVAGDKFMAFENEKEARSVAGKRNINERNKKFAKKTISLEDLFESIKEGRKEINIILKADVKGSEEAVKNSLEKISVEGVKVEVIRSGVGTITESDVVLANASNAIIIGFNVVANSKTKEVAEHYNTEIRVYNIIYKLVEDIEAAMKGMLDPEYEEVTTGEAEVRALYKFSKVGIIAGTHVTSGIIKNGSKARIIRDGVIIYDGIIGSLQREKDSAKEVKNGFDCGITIEGYSDIKEKDVIETYELVEIKK